MGKLVDITTGPVRTVLGVLVRDKTTRKNIIWATDTYDALGDGFQDRQQLTEALLLSHPDTIMPRIDKSREAQAARTRKKADAYTPVWLCNEKNNFCDSEWFGRENVFNTMDDQHGWEPVQGKIDFPEGKTWQHYVDSRRLETTCGEAPFLVSRYDASNGERIEPLLRRIGILDRKLRIVNENAGSYLDWLKWSVRAIEASYGFEYQGDNLLIARANILLTYVDYYKERWGCVPDKNLLHRVATRIVWNIWQMDGLKDTVPLGRPFEEFHQMDIYDFGISDRIERKEEQDAAYCRIFNWRSNCPVLYKKWKGGKSWGKII